MGGEKEIVIGAGRFKIHQKYETEFIWVRYLQGSLFLVSYMFAKTILDTEGWKYNSVEVGIYVVAFVVVIILISYFLRVHMPTFFAIYALPPYVNKTNLTIFFDVLLDETALPHAVRAVGRLFDIDTADNPSRGRSLSDLLCMESRSTEEPDQFASVTGGAEVEEI